MTAKRKPENPEIKRKALALCLAKNLNGGAQSASVEIESLLDILQQTKNEADFKQVLVPLTRFCEHLAFCSSRLVETVKLMGEVPEEKPKVKELPKVH